METIYRKVAVEERLPTAFSDVRIISDLEQWGEGYCSDNGNWWLYGNFYGKVTHWLEEIDLTQLQKDKEELEAWKESAMQVMSDLSLQELGKLLNVKLGTSVSEQILPSVKTLLKDKEELLEMLEKVKLLKDLILYEEVAPQFYDEAEALSKMMSEIESLIQKHKA